MSDNVNKSIVLGVDTRDLRIAQTGARTYLTELIHAWQQMPEVQLILLYLISMQMGNQMLKMLILLKMDSMAST
mgnify:CR=1 FL=1